MDHECTHKCDISVSERKYLFWANLVQNIKIVSLSWDLVPSLIRICRIQWQWSLFPFLAGNTNFGQTWSKKSNQISLHLNLGPKLIQISWIQWRSSRFFVFDWNSPFWANLVQKMKIVSLKWNLLPRLIQICRIRCWHSFFVLDWKHPF